MNKYSEYITWIKDQQNVLDEIIAVSCFTAYSNLKDFPNFKYDLEASIQDCYALGQGGDMCYDRYSVGFTYASWYQGRRTNSFLEIFAPLLYENRLEEEIYILDNGAGTGAVQIALSLCCQALRSIYGNCPQLKFVNVDTSPFMLQFLKDYLWPTFQQKYPETANHHVAYCVENWSHSGSIAGGKVWLTASYLFDQSETTDELTESFKKLIKKLQPRFIISNTSHNKRYLLDGLSEKLIKIDYAVKNISRESVFNGDQVKVKQIRQQISNATGTNLPGTPYWNERWQSTVVLENQSPSLIDEVDNLSLDLFNAGIVVRRDIKLSEAQIKAAKISDRPTHIYGPAGCGKTVVITERIINLLKDARDRQLESFTILVTTFNKGLMFYIKGWIEDLLDREEFSYESAGSQIKIGEQQNYVVELLHFDVLPTQLGWRIERQHLFNINGYRDRNFHLSRVKQAIEQLKADDNLTNEADQYLEPEYILDEYEYIIYGQDYRKWEDYSEGKRRGRTNLPYGGRSRELIWKASLYYLRLIEGLKEDSFVTRRHKFLKALQSNRHSKYDYVIVDEFQDCTYTDFKIFFQLLNNPNNLMISGDLAQAVHLGRMANHPRRGTVGIEDLRNWKVEQLDGSYRLPYRISECLENFSKSIVEEDDIDFHNPLLPFKGAPPGARPILVYGDNIHRLSQKIVNIYISYDPYKAVDLMANPIEPLTVLEFDIELIRSLNQFRPSLSITDSVLRLKGLEKKCVVWSARQSSAEDKEKFFVYTILTRTSSLLIIALTNEVPEKHKEIIKELRSDRLIYWDQQTENTVNNY